MPQLNHHDSIIIEKLNDNTLVVKTNEGRLFSKIGDRLREKGYINYEGHVKTSLVYDFDGRRKSIEFFLCRIVYLAVHKHIPEGMIVSQLDGNKRNNSISNLTLKKYTKVIQNKPHQWQEKDIRFLKSNFNELSIGQICKRLNRSDHSIRNKLKSLGLKKKSIKKAWTPADDNKLSALYNSGLSVNELADILGKSVSSIRLRASRKLNMFRSDKHLKTELNLNKFYHSFKTANRSGTLVSKCCLCDYSKYLHLHHIDGNNKNNYHANLATLCPNHHTEVENGEHDDKILFYTYRRRFSDGTLAALRTNFYLLLEGHPEFEKKANYDEASGYISQHS